MREAARARRPSRAAARSCSRASTSAPTGPEVVRDRLSRGRAPVRARAEEARAGARRRHPDLVLREGRPALLQQRRHRRCRRRQSSASTARATSPTGPATRRSTTSAPATPASRPGRRKPARIGVGICWDQWYPECGARHDARRAPRSCSTRPPSARSPTTRRSTRTSSGSARCRATPSRTPCPIVAANRIGLEDNDGAKQKFYGHSFIADHRGEIVESLGDKDEGVLDAHLRSRTRSSATAPTGASSATAAPTSTPGAWSDAAVDPVALALSTLHAPWCTLKLARVPACAGMTFGEGRPIAQIQRHPVMAEPCFAWTQSGIHASLREQNLCCWASRDTELR